MEYKNLVVTIEDQIAIIKFNRPNVLNALNIETLLELEKILDELSNNDAVRVVILTGEGKAFVAGADISQMSKFNPQEARAFAQLGHRVLSKLENLDRPVIAAINGYALGGGCEIALACDLRIIAETAKIGQPEVNLGIIPGFGGTQRLARLCGAGVAKELIYTGDMISADEAYRIGLVNKVVPQDKLLDSAKEIAQKILQKGPGAIRLTKTVINRGLDSPLETAKELEIETFALCFASGEPQEGMKAFLEKRKPNWIK
ncbi:MAG: enoyl-CoA hydratase-related protein [candidate division WOR-3 bacterium]|nr:enoyl-CoA hydratase-related protein [candidate division WOR-3 bacterium]MCX7757891.1 enoyl-CoA hydratase-related protein [candidate division WOR-3 bacterium]MDW7987346.1 enoyl-CoA hydratase-related protein [candidate division WOR-3 bacterium]